MVLLVALACVPWALVRTDGVEGGGRSQLAWRWTPSMEELLLRKLSPGGSMIAAPKKEAAAAAPAPVEAAPVEAAPVEAAPALAAVVAPMPEWPGFRGAQRDSVVRGVRIETDWERSAPEEVWRRAVGPGWSSFAVGGGLIYTQEQRGEDEVVACYRLQDGEPVWAHKERVRFWESNAGAGPRGTPWLGGGKVYALGATGVLTALDARTGGLIWKREVAKEHGVKTPEWGFAGSPLVMGGRVLVAVSGTLASYGAADGARQWSVKTGGGSYGSPQRMVLGGVEQVVMQSGTGATGVSAADGRVLWKHAWEGAAMLQPALTEEGDLLMMTGGMSGGEGVKRIGVSGGNTEERWTSRGLKPYFNDLVVHNGHAYGFDGAILSCISLQDGARKWKGGRYGYGQMLLLPEQDALLVLSEEGELALVSATPDGYREMGRRKAIEGKTWNHPALAGGLLLVRNGVEMAAFRLGAASLASSTGGR
jgi:hypothetical protein